MPPELKAKAWEKEERRMIYPLEELTKLIALVRFSELYGFFCAYAT